MLLTFSHTLQMSLLLDAAGWQPLDDTAIAMGMSTPRMILVYPHTSGADLYLCCMYMMSQPELRRRCRMLVSGLCMRGMQGVILRHFGAIRVADPGRHGGTLKSVVDELKTLDEFVVPISPKGSIDAGRWRTGYYHLAKELDCHIVVGGLDYHQKKFVFNDPFKIGNMTQQQVEDKCKNQLRHITPMRLHNCEYDTDQFKVRLPTTIVDSGRTTAIVMILCLILLTVVMIWLISHRQ